MFSDWNQRDEAEKEDSKGERNWTYHCQTRSHRESVRRNVNSRKWEPQSYNHKGLNLANDLLELVSGFLPHRCLDFSLVQP